MWKPWAWAGSSNRRAIDNTRQAAVACSRLRLERGEVELYLATRFQVPEPRRAPRVRVTSLAP